MMTYNSGKYNAQEMGGGTQEPGQPCLVFAEKPS